MRAPSLIRRRLSLPIAACLLWAPACGGDSGDDGSTDASTSLGSTESSASGTQSTSSSETTATSDSTATTTSTTTTGGDGDGDGDGDSTGPTTITTTSATGDGDGDGDGDAPPRVGTMQVYLPDALERASDLDGGATLVQINGFGVRSDGTVDLEGNTGFVRRWNFGFTSPSGDISVIYMSEDWTGDYPQIEYPAGNVVSTEAITSPASRTDSDAVVAAFEAEAGCGTLDGSDQISLLYRFDTALGGNLVQLTANGVTWGAVDDGSLSVWDNCL